MARGHRTTTHMQQCTHVCCVAVLQGASARLWKTYLPNSEVWFGEYDQKCVHRYADRIKQLGVSVVTGDQADNATLARWLDETGGNFDVIIVSSQLNSSEHLQNTSPFSST